MRKKAEGITQTKRLCTFFLFFSFFLLFFFLLLSFQSPRRDDDERWLSKSLCYRFPSGCVTACLAYTPSSRGCHPLVALYKGSAVFDERFLIVPDRGGGGGGGEKKERRRKKKRKEPVQRLVGWLVEERRQFFDPSSVHAHEGIQMQEVTHPVRSIYRSQDRAFIRSVLDTRDGEL